MGLIMYLILGAIVGWIAAAMMGRREGIIASVIIGILGSLLGSWLSTLTTGSDQAFLALSLSGLLWSIIGAVILVAILNAVQGSRTHHIGRM